MAVASSGPGMDWSTVHRFQLLPVALCIGMVGCDFLFVHHKMTVREFDMGNLDNLLDLLGCQLALPLHRKLGRTT